MTVDELVSLVEDLTAGMKVSDLRQNIGYKPMDELDDDTYAVLVRFVAGERPDGVPTFSDKIVASRQPTPEELDRLDQILADAEDPNRIDLFADGMPFGGVELP